MQSIFRRELSARIISLIGGSRKLLLLLSPYFDPWDDLPIEIEMATAVRTTTKRTPLCDACLAVTSP